MSTNSISQIMSQYGVSKSADGSQKDLDKDAFLNLLVTQLQYQDPLNPTEDKDFLAQMAQFSALEQMQNMNTSSQMSQGYDLIGKIVKADVMDPLTFETKTVEGFVDAVVLKSGKPHLLVNGQEIAIGDVSNVSYVDYESASINSMDKIQKALTDIQAQLKKLTEDRNTQTTTE